MLHTEGRKCCINDCDPSEVRPLDPVFDSSLEDCITLCDENSSCEYFSHHEELRTCVFCATEPSAVWKGSQVYSMKGDDNKIK